MVKILAIATGASILTACFIAWHASNIAAHAIANNFELGRKMTNGRI